MKNRYLNSALFLLITIIILIFLNFYLMPLTNKLFIPNEGGSIAVDNYNSLLIKYVMYLAITIIIQIFNIKIFLNKSNLLYTVRIPIISINLLNVILVLCFYIFSPMFLWLLILFGTIPILIIILSSFIVGINMDIKKNKNS